MQLKFIDSRGRGCAREGKGGWFPANVRKSLPRRRSRYSKRSETRERGLMKYSFVSIHVISIFPCRIRPSSRSGFLESEGSLRPPIVSSRSTISFQLSSKNQ